MEKGIVDEIFQILSHKNPNPRTELVYTNEFTLLVAVILSAQTTDISVNIATKPLFAVFDTPEKMLSLTEEGLKQYIRSIGLFNHKAKNIIALSRLLISKYNSRVPNNFDALLQLPGVGRKTANVVLNCLFNQPTIAVDTHVFRVSKRIGLAQGSTPQKVEYELLACIDKKWRRNAHHWLILHGRYICKARKPNCSICTIHLYCAYYKKFYSPL